MIAAVAKRTPALELLPPPGAPQPHSEVHAIADEYERWSILDQLSQQIISDPVHSGDLPLARKAFVLSEEVVVKLGELRTKLSGVPSRDLGELARKARILEIDASHWLGEDPLLDGVCADTLRLADVPPMPAPYPIALLLQRLRNLDFEAPPLPWEERPASDPKPVNPSDSTG